MRVTRVVGVLEPGGAQLSVLRLAVAQSRLGVETQLLAGDATADALALARRFGLQPEVYAPVADAAGPAPRQWTPDPGFAEWLGPRLRGAQLVHAHMFGAWWAAALAVPDGTPLVASEHNAVTWPLGDHTEQARAAARRVSTFFTHGPGAAAFTRAAGVPPDRVRPGRSAVDLTGNPLPGLPSPRVTFTGRLHPDKGPDVLLATVARMERPPAVYLVGDGPLRDVLRRTVVELGLEGVVRMPGWVDHPADYVSGASVHVVPSRQEAWSQSAVTALGLGVPVIGSAVEGLPATLGDGRGVLVPAEDPGALAAALEDLLAGRVVVDPARGRRYAARFGAAGVALDYLTVYEAALRVPLGVL
jgi:glycosyltransferase involved in cell wall biosynthesis